MMTDNNTSTYPFLPEAETRFQHTALCMKTAGRWY